MALDRWLGPLFDIARTLTRDLDVDPFSSPRREVSTRPPFEGWNARAVEHPEPAVDTAPRDDEPSTSGAIEDAVVVAEDAHDAAAAVAAPESSDPDEASDAHATVEGLAMAEDEDRVSEDDDDPADLPPVKSRAIARLLAQQGHVRRAVAMLEAMLDERPGDAGIASDLLELRAAPSLPRRRKEVEEDALAREGEIVAIRASERDVLLSWQVADDHVARGRRLMPDADRVSVRVVLFHRADGFGIRREERERFVERSGEWLVPDVPREVWMTASVGLRAGDRFLSLAHSAASRAS